MSQPFARARLAIGLALVLIGVGVVAFVVLADEPDVSMIEPAPREAHQPEPAPPRSTAAAPPPTPLATKPASERKLDRDASDRVREQIQQSFAQRSSVAARPADPASEREDDEVPELDREYIRERIKEDLLPVAIDCYESALADDPKLGGKLVMKFAILGEPEVGGVVDEATIDDEQSTLANEFMRECMRESLMAVSFDAPPDGGRVEVTYPFVFEPGEE